MPHALKPMPGVLMRQANTLKISNTQSIKAIRQSTAKRSNLTLAMIKVTNDLTLVIFSLIKVKVLQIKLLAQGLPRVLIAQPSNANWLCWDWVNSQAHNKMLDHKTLHLSH
ncbi:MAG: hypothetical protein EBR82_44795 [Caulobacteraceae bacterium]|nr:hypothetical protein [Caulobacteraceae bacterium]